jgi:hypothetical protein
MCEEIEAIKARIVEMKLEHRDLDIAIHKLEEAPGYDQLMLRRLKKRKLQLKDSIARLQSMLIPDMPA